MELKLTESIYTNLNNKIDFYSLNRTNEGMNILFLGVMHGEEPQGDFLIRKFMHKIENNELNYKNNLYFIPCLNPDGMKYNHRGNFNNVDLNRNFPTRNYKTTTFDDDTTSGIAASSELETKFLVKLVEKYKFNLILSIHAPFEIVNYDGDCKDIACEISKITGYPVQADIGYPTPGSFGTFCGLERNIPIITLEVSDKLSNDELWEQNEKMFDYISNL